MVLVFARHENHMCMCAVRQFFAGQFTAYSLDNKIECRRCVIEVIDMKVGRLIAG